MVIGCNPRETLRIDESIMSQSLLLQQTLSHNPLDHLLPLAAILDFFPLPLEDASAHLGYLLHEATENLFLKCQTSELLYFCSLHKAVAKPFIATMCHENTKGCLRESPGVQARFFLPH